MNLMKLSWAYLRTQPLNTVLNLTVLSLGIAIIVVLLLFNHQLEQKLVRDAEGIDLVIGAKGSPLQLILSSIYHTHIPTGNISLKDAEPLMHHKAVKTAIPLALGDNYRGFRIVGTSYQYLKHYQAELAAGQMWTRRLEVVIGAHVAESLNLLLESTFSGSHGLVDNDSVHADSKYHVVGILKPTNTILDQLILTSVDSVWHVHQPHEKKVVVDQPEPKVQEISAHDDAHHKEEHDHEDVHHEEEHDHKDVHHEEEHDHDDAHHEEEHDHEDAHHAEEHDHEEAHDHGKEADREITALLIQYRSPLSALIFPRLVNSHSSLQAAAPAFETARLLKLVGFGIETLRIFGALLIITAAVGVFVTLYHSLRERRYDLAIMRTLGASKAQLLWQLLYEGLLMALLGTLLGLLLGHIATEFLGYWLEDTQQLYLTGWIWVESEFLLFILAIVLGSLSALIPAIQAYRTDIASTLAER